MTDPGQSPPPPSPAVSVPPGSGPLQNMNASASQNASPVEGGVQPCLKTSWFAIRVIDGKGAVVEDLTLKLKLPGLGDAERVTSKASDPLKVEQLDAGGKGEVTSIDSGEVVWEEVVDVA